MPAELALVTGGARGIGAAVVREFVAEGRTAVILDLDADRGQDLVTELGDDRASFVECDVTDSSAVEAAVARIAERPGRIRTLVHCAGVIGTAPTAELPDATWERVLDVHLGGAMRCGRAVYPHMRGSGGSIVVIGSVVGQLGVPRRLAYASAKAGLEGLTRALAAEWARDAIRVNAVAPGYVRTPLLEEALEKAQASIDRIVDAVPIGRLGEPQEIAAVVGFLASAKASFVTGQVLVVDGGLIMGRDW